MPFFILLSICCSYKYTLSNNEPPVRALSDPHTSCIFVPPELFCIRAVQ
nr:MAG TPA: hypothetical protein [Caudoviricetes sp.]